MELVDIPNPNLRLQLHYGQRRSDPRPNPVAALGFAQRRGLGHWTSRISPKWLWFNKQHMVYNWYKNGIIHDRWYINGLFVHQNGIKTPQRVLSHQTIVVGNYNSSYGNHKSHTIMKLYLTRLNIGF